MTTDGFQVTPGVALNVGLTFRAMSLIVDNFTDSFIYIPAAARWVEPQCTRCVLPLDGTKVAQAQWSAPPGQTEPAPNTSQRATLLFTDTVLAPAAGMLGLRPNYFDRGPLSFANFFFVSSTAPHVRTTRTSYTVPNNRKAFIETISAQVKLTGAGDLALGQAQSFWSITTVAGQTTLLDAIIQGLAPIRTTAVVALGASIELGAGDVLEGITVNNYTASAAFHEVTLKGTEFDA